MNDDTKILLEQIVSESQTINQRNRREVIDTSLRPLINKLKMRSGSFTDSSKFQRHLGNLDIWATQVWTKKEGASFAGKISGEVMHLLSILKKG